MVLLTPIALLLALLSVPILLLYVLKLQRKERVVSSTLLWRRAVEDVQANAPWQRIRPSVLLLLQLLVLAALIFALAAPAYRSRQNVSGDLVVVVDESFAMQARDVAPSRFSAALAEAHRLARSLSAGNVMSVIGMGSQPTLAIAESGDQGAISQAINRLHVQGSEPNFLAALSLASSLARDFGTTRAIVLTSRESGIQQLPVQVPFPVQIVRLGRVLHDLGITELTAGTSRNQTQVITRIHNFGPRAVSSDIDLFADGKLADVRPISVGAGQTDTQFWTNLPLGIREVQLRVEKRDDLLADKSAQAAISVPSPRRVLLVSNGDYFLQTALAVDPTVRLGVIRPSAYSSSVARGFAVVVFEGFLPPRLPLASTLVISPPSGRLGPMTFGAARSVGPLTSGTDTGVASPGSLLRYVDLADVHLRTARQTAAPRSIQPIVASNGLSVVSAGSVGTTRVAVCAFDLSSSDWPLRLGFPVFVHNVLRFLDPSTGLSATTISQGQSVTLLPAPGVREVAVQKPDGSIVRIRAPFPPFTDTGQSGFYVVRQDGGGVAQKSVFAVNLFPSRPRPVRGPSIVLTGRATKSIAHRDIVPVNIAWVGGMLALCLLSIEWWFALRR